MFEVKQDKILVSAQEPGIGNTTPCPPQSPVKAQGLLPLSPLLRQQRVSVNHVHYSCRFQGRHY